jgi:putative PIN family toxin of toxin-antitoxin system
MRAILDPSVLVSALISPLGPSAQIVAAWVDNRFDLVVSPQLLAELTDVVHRPKFRRWVSIHTATDFIAGIEDAALLIGDPPPTPGLTPDPNDDYLVSLAGAADVDVVVSGDAHLLGLADAQPPVLTPRQFLDQLVDDVS